MSIARMWTKRWRPLAAGPVCWLWLLAPLFALSGASSARASCGDGLLESALETCDDGNVAAGDGCTATCQREAGYLCSGAPSLCCFADAAAGYALLGQASYDAATAEVTLVPAVGFRAGVGWYRQPLDFTRPFSIAFALYLGTRDDMPQSNVVDTGADGAALLFQRDPRGLAAQGETGGASGAYGSEFGALGIVPVLGVEFDTYNNLAAYADETTGDEDHLSVFHTRATPGTNHLVTPRCLNEGSVCRNFEDGGYHAVVVRWTGDADHHLLVSFDGAPRIDLADDLIGAHFGDDPRAITFGLAAGTGGAFNLHKFCPKAPRGFVAPRDFDRDGSDDGVDPDDDGDGVSDRDETGGVFGADDPGADHDLDGTPNASDPDYWTTTQNPSADCSDVVVPIGACDAMPSALDFDRDGVIDSLDLDSDGDAVPDLTDTARLDACRPSPSLPSCVVPDVDAGQPAGGAADASTRDASARDAGPSDAGGSPVVPICEPPSEPICLDSDGDQVPNGSDVAPDNPCLPDGRTLACASGDRDGDGLPNDFECAGLSNCRDTDRDGVADYADTDSDGDGQSDRSECRDVLACPDSDGDGVPDLLQAPHAKDAGGCSVHGGFASGLGWLLAMLIASLLGRARPATKPRRIERSPPR